MVKFNKVDDVGVGGLWMISRICSLILGIINFSLSFILQILRL